MAVIVFDLDGTLIDSVPDIHSAINVALILEGVRPLTLPEARGFIGHGIPNLVRCAREARDIPEEAQERLVAEMIRAYMENPEPLTAPFPGVVEALEALQAQGHRLALCTNKAMAPTKLVLDQLDLARFFEVVIGGDSLPTRKPDPAMLHATFEAMGARGLYVGDSEVDAATAHAADAPFALFTLGYRKAAPEELPHQIAFDDWSKFIALAAEHL